MSALCSSRHNKSRNGVSVVSGEDHRPGRKLRRTWKASIHTICRTWSRRCSKRWGITSVGFLRAARTAGWISLSTRIRSVRRRPESKCKSNAVKTASAWRNCVRFSLSSTTTMSEFSSPNPNQLRERGFSEDQSPGAPICRWLAEGLALDVMPTREEILGFANEKWLAAHGQHGEAFWFAGRADGNIPRVWSAVTPRAREDFGSGP